MLQLISNMLISELSLKDGYAAVKIPFAAQKSAATGEIVKM